MDAGGLGEPEPEVDREVEQPRGEAALPVPVEVCDEAHADGAAGRLPGARTRCGKLEASEVAATPTEKRTTAAPSSRGRCQVSAARPNSAPHTENTRMNAGPASTCSRLVSVSSPRPGPGYLVLEAEAGVVPAAAGPLLALLPAGAAAVSREVGGGEAGLVTVPCTVQYSTAQYSIQCLAQ